MKGDCFRTSKKLLHPGCGYSGFPADEDDLIWSITEALQQIIFKMNKEGGSVKSAVAVGLSGYSGLPSAKAMYIDRPFLTVVWRNGISCPFFGGYFDKESWLEIKEK